MRKNGEVLGGGGGISGYGRFAIWVGLGDNFEKQEALMKKLAWLLILTSLFVACLANPVMQQTPPSSDMADSLTKYEGDNVFGFIKGKNMYEPVWDAAMQGYTYQADDPREKIIIDQDFKIRPRKTVTFTDKIILIRPKERKDIEIFGTLILNNCLLLWQQTQHLQTQLVIKQRGNLVINHSYSLRSNRYWVYWYYEDGATVKFNHFVGDPWTTIKGSVNYSALNFSTVKLSLMHPMHDASILVENAHHVWFELRPAPGTYTITFPAKRRWADWNITGLWPKTTVVVKKSYIFARDLSIINDTHVTIQDTRDSFGLGWSIHKEKSDPIQCELKNLGDPNNREGVFYENMTWNVPGNNSLLTVRNSVLQGVWPVIWGDVHESMIPT